MNKVETAKIHLTTNHTKITKEQPETVFAGEYHCFAIHSPAEGVQAAGACTMGAM